jgi:aspyridone synthetase (hybrid polyketide synthase/nonribosomal peptide synthetase)
VDVILDHLKVPREASSNPLFQLVFNYRIGAVAEMTLGGNCQLSADSYHDAEVPFDLGFGVYEVGDGTHGLQVIAQKSLYDEDAAHILLDRYHGLLDMLASSSSQTVEQYADMHDNSALVQAGILAGKGPRQTWDWPDTLSKRVDMMIEEYRDDTAIINSEVRLTYGGLEHVILSTASLIHTKAPKAGSVVAVLCQPSSDLVIALLAILRLGLVYVPLDTNLPPERLRVILEDCTPSLFLYHEKTVEMASKLPTHVSSLNLSLFSAATSEFGTTPNLSRPDHPAFLLYTSGSSGKPKGIQLNNAGYLNHLALKTSALSLTREVVLQQSSFGFDMSLTQVFCALANGGSLVIVPKKSRADPMALSELIAKHGVTFTIATPSEYKSLLRYGMAKLQECSAWRHACMGGEVVTQDLIRSFSELSNSKLELTNCYGPTETSLAVSFERGLERSKKRDGQYGTVGTILPNNSVYVVDEVCGRPVALGYTGEICVGGAGVAMGYLNLPGLSAAKFVPDPFVDAEDAAQGWSTMFKTGDRGRLRSDGSLIYMGRIDGDRMIKLRGVRIDLEDVANTLLDAARDTIAEAVVTVYGEDEAGMLIAHVVLRDLAADNTSSDSLRDIAQNLPLPAYMRPTLVVPRTSLPRTTNGKIDYKRLAAMELPLLHEQSSNKSNGRMSLEVGELSLLWTEVLQENLAEKLSSESDFFMVGGSSLLLVQLQGLIKENMGMSVPIAELYQASSLGRMAARLKAQKTHQEPQEEIDWDKETDFRAPESQLLNPSPELKRPAREVLLTGAHSFSGAEILQALVKDSNIKRIHCIAIPKTAMKSIASGPKIICYPGQLQASTLGLTPEDLRYLQPRIDTIIHAGSIGHCLNNYSSVRAPNLGSVRFLIDFALPRSIPLHFISSNRVALLSGTHIAPPVSVSSSFPPTDGSEGFTASKWAGERLLESVACQTGLPITIHRACGMTGPNAPREDALNALLRFSVAQRAVPYFQNLTGYLDFAPAESVAAQITRLATTSPSLLQRDEAGSQSVVRAAPVPDAPSCVVVHHSSGVKTPMTEFGARMQTLYGSEFGRLDMREWIARAADGGMDPLISSYLESLVEKGRVIEFPYLGAEVVKEV